MLLYVVYFIGLLSSCFVLFSLYFKYNKSGRLINKIPGDKGVPIFENAFDLLLKPDEMFKYLRKSYKVHKGIHKMKFIHYRNINIYDPPDVEKVLSTTRFNNKRVPYTFLASWLGQGLLISNGTKWHERRKMLTPAFHFNILKKFLITIKEQTDELLSLVEREVGNDFTEVQSLVAKTTLRVMCETSMGTAMKEDIRTVTDEYFKAVHILGECLVHRISHIWLFPELNFILTQAYRIQKKAVKKLHLFTKKIIQERREFKDNSLEMNNFDVNKKSKMAMLDLLLEQEKLGKIDEDGIREEVDTFMFEGYDTTATALTFTIMRLANEKDVQIKIVEELYKIFGDSKRETTNDDLQEMKYLECCIKESMRLYPPVPYISRLIEEESVLGGYTVPEFTECNIHVYDIHHRADVFPEPEKFIPERFLQENIAKRHPYSYIPFSAGPRNCIGQKFAMMEMKTVLSGLLRRFHLIPITKPEDVEFKCDIVLRATRPFYVKFIRRNKAI